MSKKYKITKSDNCRLDTSRIKGPKATIVDNTPSNTSYKTDSSKEEVSIFDNSDLMRLYRDSKSSKGKDELNIFLKKGETLTSTKLPLGEKYSENPREYKIIDSETKKVKSRIIADGIDEIKVYREDERPFPYNAANAEEKYNGTYFNQDKSTFFF